MLGPNFEATSAKAITINPIKTANTLEVVAASEMFIAFFEKYFERVTIGFTKSSNNIAATELRPEEMVLQNKYLV